MAKTINIPIECDTDLQALAFTEEIEALTGKSGDAAIRIVSDMVREHLIARIKIYRRGLLDTGIDGKLKKKKG